MFRRSGNIGQAVKVSHEQTCWQGAKFPLTQSLQSIIIAYLQIMHRLIIAAIYILYLEKKKYVAGGTAVFYL